MEKIVFMNLFYAVLSCFKFYLQPILQWHHHHRHYYYFMTPASTATPLHQQQTGTVHDEHQENLSQKELNTVMDVLGLGCIEDGSECELDEQFGADDLAKLFREEEPSLEEVKEVFEVFDENKDGFIDAVDLKRCLCRLGFVKEGAQAEEYCRRMIQGVDENGFGKICFRNFLRFMEDKCF